LPVGVGVGVGEDEGRVLMLVDILVYDAATTVLGFGFVYSTNKEKR
jgi:hypothetical protein